MRNEQVRSPLQDYIQDRESDSHLPRQLATQSTLQVPVVHQSQVLRGKRRGSQTTSLLLSGDESLAALTSSPTETSSLGPPSSFGERDLNRRLRRLESRTDGVLVLPSAAHTPILECPFHFLYCVLSFTSFGEWFAHSLTHFRHIDPPRTTQCCMCEQRFQSSDGKRSWYRRLEHTLLHHQCGHTLASARPEFELYEHLWTNSLIGRADYKALTENRLYPGGAARAYHSSPASSMVETDDNSTVYIVQNESRRRQKLRTA
ncbi:hypothetical protein MMC09_003872 [Bachmanniomyces sp. S44760]|nr:hypothetical protein [Bachmanniomyces sp. S44760]